jgi:hypothetical protein
VLAIESVSRQRMLGSACSREWASMRSLLDEGTPCVGWVAEHVAAYGRGVQPTGAPGVLVVVTLGDTPR